MDFDPEVATLAFLGLRLRLGDLCQLSFGAGGSRPSARSALETSSLLLDPQNPTRLQTLRPLCIVYSILLLDSSLASLRSR